MLSPIPLFPPHFNIIPIMRASAASLSSVSIVNMSGVSIVRFNVFSALLQYRPRYYVCALHQCTDSVSLIVYISEEYAHASILLELMLCSQFTRPVNAIIILLLYNSEIRLSVCLFVCLSVCVKPFFIWTHLLLFTPFRQV